MTRKLEFMDYELFKIILEDLNNINLRNGGFQIQLHHFGESTFHPELEKFLKLCRHYRIKSMISSNGATLDERISNKIIDNLDVLWFSFDSVDKEIYEKMRKGASFERTVQNIIDFMKLKGNKRPEVILSSLIETDQEVYRDFWKDKGDFKFLFKNYHNWRHEPDIVEFTGIKKEITNNPCLYLLTSFTVLVNGDVVPCCMDYEGEMILGNLRRQTIGEVWYGQRYKNIRAKHIMMKKQDVNLCKGCTEYPQPTEKPEVKQIGA